MRTSTQKEIATKEKAKIQKYLSFLPHSNKRGRALLLEVKDIILEEPKRVDMGMWGQFVGDDPWKGKNDIPKCGTVACIGGWAAILTTKFKASQFDSLNELNLEIDTVTDDGGSSVFAENVLGLNSSEQRMLFHVGNWDFDLQQLYESEGPHHKPNMSSRQWAKNSAKATAMAIDRLIARKDREKSWPKRTK